MGKHFLGDYKPVNIYRNNVKLAGWTATEKTGESISYTDTYNDKFNSLIADGAEPQSLADWHGRDGALSQLVTVQGKNFCPTDFSEWESGEYLASTGAKAANGARLRPNRLLAVTPSTTYYAAINSNISFLYFVIRGYGSSGKFLRTIASGVRASAFDVAANEYFISVTMYYLGTPTYTYEIYQAAFAAGEILPFYCLNSEPDKTYEPFVPDSPSPEYPSVVTPNILAGSYKIARLAGGWWTITLTDDIRGISTYTDKVNMDLLTGKGKLRKRISKKVFDGTEAWNQSITANGHYRVDVSLGSIGVNATGVSTHFAISAATDNEVTGFTIYFSSAIIYHDGESAADFKVWLSTQYAAGTPVTVYYVLETETVTDLTLTHTDTSDLPELTLTDLGITVSSLDYPFTIYESNNNILSISNATEVKQTVNLPTLRAIGTVKDRFDILAGVKTHKVSERINPADYTMTATPQTGYMQMFTPVISGALANSAIHGYKYNGAKLGNGMAAIDYGKVHTDGTICITAAPTDTGWGVTPTATEVKAYFLGWMMCHDDGTAPYLSGTKNWKHVTDGLGKTATLPTATYAGYNSYRLLYQLATPAEEQLTGTSVPTYPWHTDIAQTGDVLTTVTANAKVMD